MRTTVNLDGGLLEAAKLRAQAERRTLGDLVEVALQAYLVRTPVTAVLPLPVFARGTGARPGIETRSNASMFDALDEDDQGYGP
jgi:hypothetical protein